MSEIIGITFSYLIGLLIGFFLPITYIISPYAYWFIGVPIATAYFLVFQYGDYKLKQKYEKIVESEIAFLREYAQEWYDELPPTAHADLLRRIKKLEGEE